MSGVDYHIAGFAWERATLASSHCSAAIGWEGICATVANPPRQGVHEPSYGYSARAQRVKRLLLATLGETTNSDREAHEEK